MIPDQVAARTYDNKARTGILKMSSPTLAEVVKTGVALETTK